MKQEIDARRRVRISLFSGQGSPAGTYLFDAQGNFLEVKAGRPLAEKEIILLAGEVRKMPGFPAGRSGNFCGRGNVSPSPSCVIFT